MKTIYKNPRHIATAAIEALMARRIPCNRFLAETTEFGKFSVVEQNYVRHLLTTLLKRLGQVDAIISLHLAKKLPAKLSPIQNILRVGVCELVFMEGAPHGVINSAVDLVGLYSKAHKGMVNAVLRRVAEKREESAQRFPLETNLPEWFRSSLGERAEEAATSLYLPNYIDITAKENPERLTKELSGVLLPNGTVRLKDASGITELEGYSEGKWWVQDVSASIPASLLTGDKTKECLDLCAAPGGKTAQLALKFGKVIAVEKSKKRIKQLEQNLTRLGLSNVEIINADVLEYSPDRKFSAILLDAPCTSSGLIKKDPDILYTKSKSDIAEMKALQKQLLKAAISMLSEGGELVYSVCSIFNAEGEEVILETLNEVKNIEVVPVRNVPAECLTKEGFFRALPYQMAEYGGMDGFFAAKLHFTAHN